MYRYSRVVRYLFFSALFLLGIMALHPRVAVSEPLGDQNRQNPVNSFPGGAAARDPLSAVTKLSGTLMVQWGDPIDPQAEALVLYDFFTEDGNRYRLDGDALRRAYGGNPQGLHRQSVTITIRQADLDLRARPDRAVQVQTIQPNPEQGRSTDAPDVLEGNLPYISVLCAFPDGATPFKPLSYYKNMYGNSYPFLDHYWRELSYNKISLAGSDAIGPFTMPHSYTYYGEGENPDLNALAIDCLAAAESSADFTLYHGINLMFNHGWMYSWGGASCGVIDGEENCSHMTWLSDWGWSTLHVVAHEMGHTFLLPHSTDQYGNEYGSAWDVMSGGYCKFDDNYADYGCLSVHTIAHFKAWLGWIPPSKIFNAVEGSNQGIRIERLALPATGDYQMVRIPHLSRDDLFYTLEARRRVGYDEGLPDDGVIIHKVTGESYEYWPGWAQVVDGDGNGTTWDDGATWTVGETFSDPSFGVSVTVVSADATGYTVDIDLAPPPPFTNCSNQDSIPVAECLALTALYNSTDGDEWTTNSSWLLDLDPCYWARVACVYNAEATAAPYYNVIELQMGGNNLKGTLPAELENLEMLEYLGLGGNKLSGSIPPELGNLRNLEVLWMNRNQLSGPLPPELGNLGNLKLLELGTNRLSWPLSAELGNLENLESLYLYDNQLNGPLPTWLGNLENLAGLSLWGNHISGSLPPWLGNLSQLNYLNLESNLISGALPAELGNLESLSSLSLSNNQLSGSIPAELGNLENLGYLALIGNEFSGPLSPELGNLDKLNVLLVNNTSLSGPLPRELTQLALEVFDFSDTNLCELPDSAFQAWLGSIALFVSGSGLKCTASLQINFADGAPGSYFHINGVVFEPNVTASVSVNGVGLGNVQTDANGDLIFRLSTSSADEGSYVIKVVAGGDQAVVSILLDSAAPVRPLSGTAPEIALPAGIALDPLFLPVVAAGS